jgi:hypothetical protein
MPSLDVLTIAVPFRSGTWVAGNAYSRAMAACAIGVRQTSIFGRKQIVRRERTPTVRPAAVCPSPCIEALFPRRDIRGRRLHFRRDRDIPWVFIALGFHKVDLEAIVAAFVGERFRRGSIGEHMRKVDRTGRTKIAAVSLHPSKDFSVFFKQRHRHL